MTFRTTRSPTNHSLRQLSEQGYSFRSTAPSPASCSSPPPGSQFPQFHGRSGRLSNTTGRRRYTGNRKNKKWGLRPNTAPLPEHNKGGGCQTPAKTGSPYCNVDSKFQGGDFPDAPLFGPEGQSTTMKPSLRSRKAGNRNASFPQQSRVPSNRYEAVNLSEWLQENLEMLAQKFNNDSASRNVPENILGLTSAATQLFNTALLELSRQVTVHCEERGNLLIFAWQKGTAVLLDALNRMNTLRELSDRRAEELQRSLSDVDERTNATLLNAAVEGQKLQNEILSLKAKLRMCDPGLTTARSTGQAIRSTVFVEDLDTNRSTLTSCSQDLRQESIASGSPPKATFSGFADRRKMRASVMANDLLKQMEVLRDEYVGLDELDSSDVASLKSQNEKLQDALNECKREVEAMMEQITVLETQVEEIPTIRYKLEEAKHEHQEAVSKISLLTPRPPVSLSIHRDKIGLEACRRLERAINEHRDWPPNTLAQYLLGEGVACNDEGGKESFGCLGKLVREDCFALGALKEAILEHNVGWFLRYCTKSQAGWIETQISTGCCVESLTQYLTGLSESGAPLSQEWWGCMSNVWNGGRLLAASELQGMIEGAFEPTLERVVELEKKLAELQTNFDRKGLQQ